MDSGSLQLSLVWDGRQIAAATVASTRPPVARALCGLPAARVLEVVPRVFSLCRRAQGAAARLCLQAARGELVVPGAEPGLAVALEAIGEHLYHLLIGWPQVCAAVDAGVRQQELVTWRSRLQSADDEQGAATLGKDLVAWLQAFPWPAFDEPPTGQAAALLPQLSAAEWAKQDERDIFGEWPTFAGLPAETGALAAHHADAEVAAHLGDGRRLSARIAARIAELRHLSELIAAPRRAADLLDAASPAPGCGLARVKTARGTLLHRVEVDGDRVRDYRIVAPTEWNFHPQGSFVCEMVGQLAPTRAAAADMASRLALALDPCVPYTVQVGDA